MSASDDEEKCNGEREGDVVYETGSTDRIRNAVCDKCREGQREKKVVTTRPPNMCNTMPLVRTLVV